MSTIARMMPHCKLYMQPKAGAMAEDDVCAWSGERTNLHAVALVPIEENCTMALGAWPKEPGLVPIQFHIAAAFTHAIKCVHTNLFILDYIPFQADACRKKAEMHLKGPWCPEMERELEELVLHTKTGPVYAIRKAVVDMIKANMNAFRAIIGPELAADYLVPFAGNDGRVIEEAREAAKAASQTVAGFAQAAAGFAENKV